MTREFGEKCGVCGIFGHPEASNLTYLGLHALQHRGQESSGIVSSDRRDLYSHRAMGLVADIFDSDVLKRLPGDVAIGHDRYSTAGSSEIKNAQPFVVETGFGSLAVAHNGNLVNAIEVRSELERAGAIFQSTMDTEVIVHLMARADQPDIAGRLVEALRRVKGSYSLLIMAEDQLLAVRDPNGFRPLVLGRLKDAVVFASETCALDLIGATFEREVEPGELIVVDREGMRTFRPFPAAAHSHCVFELIYFSRPDSLVFGRTVHDVRKRLGRRLARETAIVADVVVPVPDSGVPAALGFAEAAGIPFDTGLIRNHYVGRTFIEPRQSIRHFGVKLKLNPVRSVDRGQAGGRRRRLDRARHDEPQDRQDAARRRRRRGAHAHLQPADDAPLLLRHRHADAPGAGRRDPPARADPDLPHGGLARLPQPRGAAPGRPPRGGDLLLRLLQRGLPGELPVRGGLPDAPLRRQERVPGLQHHLMRARVLPAGGGVA